MFTVTPREGAIPLLELADDSGPSRVVLAPSRGGMMTRFDVAGRALLYLDRVTFEDLGSNVRGGNPVLFPSPGKLEDDRWARDGKSGAMKQHGFARNLPWEVVATGTDDGAWATLRLRANAVTLAQYPWAFRAEYTYRLRGGVVRIDMRFANESDTTMPFGAGFHPYFAVRDADKPRVRVDARATWAYDNVTKRVVLFDEIDFRKPELDLHLLDSPRDESSIALDGDPDSRVALRCSPEFRSWVFWTLAGRDFVCVEPWTCQGNALNIGDRLLEIAPGAARDLWVEYVSAAVQPAGGQVAAS